jgi:CHASE2 domain-containing sensor protein
MGSADAWTTTRGFAVAALALAGFLFCLTPVAVRLDDALLDVEWSLLRKFASRPAPDDILIVGVDEASVRSIDAPPGLWHEPIGLALAAIASARPRAIGIDLALPERSYESFHPGLDRALLDAMIAARRNGIVVAALSIDPRTRAARPIDAPILAILGEEGLGIGLLGRDGDGVTRRFSIAIPTQDGAFPTLAGRLCRALSRRCTDGLIDYALGPAFKYVPLHTLLGRTDPVYLSKLFRDRVVLIGDVRLGDRIAVPINLAGWEEGGHLSPSVVVHAQSLRTALADAPEEASRPLRVLLAALAALIVLARRAALAAVAAIFIGITALCASTALLRAGLFVPVGGVLATLALGVAVAALRSRFGRP